MGKFTQDEYRRYLQSPYWNRVRGLLMYQRGGKCEICKSPKRLEAHHLRYINLRRELSNLQDLQLLCHDCHVKLTLDSRKKKKNTLAKRIIRFILK